MKVIRLTGIKEESNIIKYDINNLTNDCIIFILDSNVLLHEFLQDMELSPGLLYKLKISNEIDFSGTFAELKDKITDELIMTNIESLSTLLEAVSEQDLNNYRLIFDTEDSDFISKVVQSIIYLDLELEVMMKKEKKDRLKLNAFRKNYENIRSAAAKAENELQSFEAENFFVDEKDKYVSTFSDINEDLEKTRDRELNISIMSTKKAGKSSIVNSFLKEQYAPVSLELPTPNNCIYRRSRENTIRLLYGEQDILFKTPKDIYGFIYNEFKNAQKDKEKQYIIDDMEIYYREMNSTIAPYTIIDTPGSNYVSAKSNNEKQNSHKSLVYKWIDKSDVVLFLINYSNYLTEDEEEFFKSIKHQFEKLEKYYSLIVVVNKLDEMYMSECENKSVVRFLDYIRQKLYELGYKSFVVIGTSARTYFDIIKLEKIDNECMGNSENYLPIEFLKGTSLRSRIKSLKNRYIGKPEMSFLCFVDEQLENLECFYGLKDYSLDTLREKSGIPKLEKYTAHVAMQKANVESYRKYIREIDEKYIKISNGAIINKLTDSKNESLSRVYEVEGKIHDMIERFNIIQDETIKNIDFSNYKEKFFSEIKISMDKILEHMVDIGEARVDESFMKFLLKGSSELRMIKNKINDLEFTVNKKMFNDELKLLVENSVNKLNDEIDMRENIIMDAENLMKELVDIFNEDVMQDYNIAEFNIKIPEIDQEFNKNVMMNMPDIDINDEVFKEKIRESIEFKENSLQSFINMFKKQKSGIYYINTEKLRMVNIDYISYIKSNEYGEYYNLLIDNLSIRIDENMAQLRNVFDNVSKAYEDIFNDIMINLSNIKQMSEEEIAAYNKNLGFYTEINERIADFSKYWELVRKAGS